MAGLLESAGESLFGIVTSYFEDQVLGAPFSGSQNLVKKLAPWKQKGSLGTEGKTLDGAANGQVSENVERGKGKGKGEGSGELEIGTLVPGMVCEVEQNGQFFVSEDGKLSCAGPGECRNGLKTKDLSLNGIKTYFMQTHDRNFSGGLSEKEGMVCGGNGLRAFHGDGNCMEARHSSQGITENMLRAIAAKEDCNLENKALSQNAEASVTAKARNEPEMYNRQGICNGQEKDNGQEMCNGQGIYSGHRQDDGRLMQCTGGDSKDGQGIESGLEVDGSMDDVPTQSATYNIKHVNQGTKNDLSVMRNAEMEGAVKDDALPSTSKGPNTYTIHMSDNCVLQIGSSTTAVVNRSNETAQNSGLQNGLDYTDESSEDDFDLSLDRDHDRDSPKTRYLQRNGSFESVNRAEENSYRTESRASERLNPSNGAGFGPRRAGFDPRGADFGPRGAEGGASVSHYNQNLRQVAHSADDDDDPEDPVPFSLHIDVYEEMFYGRTKEMKQLADMFKKNNKVGISGMGGAGKTTFVSLYALQNRTKYRDGVFFVDASLISTLPVEFAKLAGPGALNLIQQPTKNIETSMSLVMDWLMSHKHYLLVFDAADDARILNLLGLQKPKGHRYIPPKVKLKGHVIITSQCPSERFQSVQVMRPMVLGDLDHESTFDFMWKRVHYDSEIEENEEERRSLGELMSRHLPGRLPIHLEQTAAYIRGQNTNFSDYLADMTTRFAQGNPIDDPCFGDNTKSVNVTFRGNFLKVEEEKPEAFSILAIGALCHSKDIPLALFTLGLIAMLRGDKKVPANLGDLLEYLTEDVQCTEPIRQAAESGIRRVKDLLNIPRKKQLVKLSPFSKDFTIHEVIQQQLRLFLMDREEIQSVLECLAQMLLFMFTSDDLPLHEKRQYLSHAEACARNMEVFGIPNKTYKHLFLRLRIKTGHVFALLGTFTTAEEIIKEVEKKMPGESADVIKMELLGLKALVCLLKNAPQMALEYGRQALELESLSVNINSKDKEVGLEVALVRMTLAEALLSMFEVMSDDVGEHLSSSQATLEMVQRSTHINCENHIARLIMLQGVLHRRRGDQYKSGQYKVKGHQEASIREFQCSLQYFEAAAKKMSKESIFMEVVQIFEAETKLKLEKKPSYHQLHEALQKVSAAHESLVNKVTENHQYVAWAMEQMAHIQVDLGNLAKGLHLIEDTEKILNQIYDKTEGVIPKGRVFYAKGRALFQQKDFSGSRSCMEMVVRLLDTVRNNPAYVMAQSYITLIKTQNLH